MTSLVLVRCVFYTSANVRLSQHSAKLLIYIDCMIKSLTRLFSYPSYIKPLNVYCPWLYLGQLSTLGLGIRANMKTAMW